MASENFSTDFVFIDSGSGGVPYMEYLKKFFPNHSCAYYADRENFPYGTKTTEQIIACVSAAVEKIIAQYNPKVIVLACNTMTVAALETLRKKYSVPFVGTVPAIKLAAKISANKKIGLLATEQTCKNEYTKKLITDFASDCEVFSRGDTSLVEFVETKFASATKEEKLCAIKPSVDYFISNGVDTIILGCTHFVHLYDEFAELAEKNARIVDSREGVVKQAMRLLEKK